MGIDNYKFITRAVARVIRLVTINDDYYILIEARYFAFLYNFLNFSILRRPPRILGGFTWRLQKEPPVTNSKLTIGFSLFLKNYPPMPL